MLKNVDGEGAVFKRQIVGGWSLEQISAETKWGPWKQNYKFIAKLQIVFLKCNFFS